MVDIKNNISKSKKTIFKEISSWDKICANDLDINPINGLISFCDTQGDRIQLFDINTRTCISQFKIKQPFKIKIQGKSIYIVSKFGCFQSTLEGKFLSHLSIPRDSQTCYGLDVNEKYILLSFYKSQNLIL